MSKKKKELALANDVIQYQPDAIELANSKLPWWANCGVLWLFAFFVGIIVWASIGKVDVIVQATGKVISTVPNITMSPISTMVIDEVCVREGDRVKKGQLLFRFDRKVYEADLTNYTESLDKLEPMYLRLKAEFENKTYVPADPKNSNQRIQMTLFEQRARTYISKIKYYDSVIAATQSQIKSVEDSISSLEKSLVIYNDIVDRYRSLKEKKVVAIVELNQIEMQLISYQSQLIQYQNAIPNYESQLASNHAERQAYIETWKQQVAEEYNEAEQQYLQNLQQLEKMKRYLAYCELVSPADAMVQEIAKYAPGSAVREAEPLITMIPLGVEYIIEVEIPAKDVSKIKARRYDSDGNILIPGADVRVKLTPFPFQTWGTMKGELTLISEDAFTRQQQSAESMMAGNTYYRGQVTITETFSREPENFIMKPGMEAQAEIITGRRRIISYIFHPLIKMLDESLREP